MDFRTIKRYYSVLAVLGLGAIVLLLQYGSQVFPTNAGATILPAENHPVARILMALVVIVLASKIFGQIFARIGQPPVMGEVIAGIALGPSLLGRFLPGVQSFIFPTTIYPVLQALAQIGVILFMFVVGMEFNLKTLKKKGAASVLISHASMFVPFLLGILMAFYIFPRYAPPQISFVVFALFIGVSVSVTAFPVLARIIKDLGMEKSPLAVLTLACAAVDDVSAWCLLALVSSIAAADPGKILWTFGLTVTFVTLLYFVVRPYLQKLAFEAKPRFEAFTQIMVIMLLAAWCSDMIGIHALFGAFFVGVMIPPESPLAHYLIERLEKVTATLFLPTFFAFTGLRTQMQLIDGSEAWLLAGLVLSVAVIGKLGGTSLAARATGIRWRDSLALGTLMNTRGLVELIVLSLGLDLGILSPFLFAVFVLMAITTTMMTGPLFQWITRSAPWSLGVESKAKGALADQS